MKHLFSVDLEDWYQGNELVKADQKYRYEDRISYSTSMLLDLLDEFSIHATFFVLAHCVEGKSILLKEIANRGHEIASHGYSHELVYLQTPKQFKEETRISREILEDLSGTEVKGYRASNWSITNKSLWALDVLADLDFRYDSSIYPAQNYLYGIAGAPTSPYIHENGLLEIPPAVFEMGNARIPFAGGFYLRALPFPVIKYMAKRLERADRRMMCYIHPWELDLGQPKNLDVPFFNRFIHYHNLKGSEPKLKRLFQMFNFTNVAEVFDEIYAIAKGRSNSLGEFHDQP